MKRFVLPLLIPCLAALSVPAGARAAEPLPAAQNTSSLTTSTERLDTLFADLKHARDPDAAREISERIRIEWTDSGSASVNLLMQWADKAVAENRRATALDILDQIIYLSPRYVEGWNRRATLNYLMGNYRKSMSDINRVLALEPRHFGAMAGMAAILSSAGQDELALRAWERFLEVYPSDRQAQQQAGELSEKLAGKRT